MIGSRINKEYNHQFIKIQNFIDHIFLVDYTEQTKLHPVKRSVEFFSPIPPTDIPFFTIKNELKLSVDGIDFDNLSFVREGLILSQCESVFFPHVSNSDSWILFCELKYSSTSLRNNNNLQKAIKQLYKSRYYYFQSGIINYSNTSYLIASLPIQSEPFLNFVVSQPMLTNLKRKKNIVLRFKNSVEIIDEKLIQV